ncbi:hypothetical protein QUF84_08340 [Fictibacillus enclensis]|uniref:hypothetical protein n=1 Tax=Fictibacillus enclensis TaxID=1017270 RepID=UPI0025A2C62E|nr:hypothetical protein [Fictibacillus enclensis]MDM5198077.1 hypothetical protein [Fictibacillus enclensis]MDM5337222.1 hypothetical protein [Fictibacillus enclensis]
MKKPISTFIVTLVGIIVLNFVCSWAAKVSFIDVAFITGLASAVILKFFTSSGGFFSNSARLQAQAQTGIKGEEEKKAFSPGISFYTAVGYTICSVIATAIYYREYFL